MRKTWTKGLAMLLCLLLMLPLTVLAADMGMPPNGGMMMDPPPDGGSGGGAAPPGDGAPENAAIVIADGQEIPEREYGEENYKDCHTVDGDVYTISGMEMTSDDYTFNGLIVTGPDSKVRIEKSTIRLGVGSPASDEDTGGAAVSIDDGATVFISDSKLTVDGAARYVTANYNDGTLVVNNSTITSTGSNANTADVSEPFSNEALLISGTARANFSIGATKTCYFNSVCMAEGWAALSTDSATGDGLDLYAYNTEGIAENGGYSTYADTNCRVWLYGSRLTAAEIGAIISKSGQIHAYNSSAADEELLSYNEGDTVKTDTSIIGGRNAVMIHAPDMMGQGLLAADCGTFCAEDTFLGTSDDLVSTKDYYDYGDAVGKYIDYVSGSIFLIRSTSANIDLQNVRMESYNNTLVHSVLNADSMGNFLAAGDGEQVDPIAVTMTDMEVSGDILHEDYQRRMTVELKNTTLSGNVISGTMESWNNRWKDYGEVNWVVDDNYETQYGVELTVGDGAVWNVTGASSLARLTLEEGGTINGDVTLDGEALTPEPGKTYTGEILVCGDYVPKEEAEPEMEEASAKESAAESSEALEPPKLEASEEAPVVSQAPEEISGGVSPTVIVVIVLVVIAVLAVAAVVIYQKKKTR